MLNNLLKSRMKTAAFALLCLLNCAIVAGAKAPNPSIVYTTLPSPGGMKGVVTTAVKWDSCGGNIGSVSVNLWSQPGGNKKLVAQPTLTPGNNNPILADGSYSWNPSGLTSGVVISITEAVVLDQTAPNPNVIATTGQLSANSVPVAFNGCTVP